MKQINKIPCILYNVHLVCDIKKYFTHVNYKVYNRIKKLYININNLLYLYKIYIIWK